MAEREIATVIISGSASVRFIINPQRARVARVRGLGS